MTEYRTIDDYLGAVEEQIRWKRARPGILQELRGHLEDQRDAFAADGHDDKDAERLAAEEMGDPIALGNELNLLHRPRPQWKLLALAAVLALAGGLLRVLLYDQSFAYTGYTPAKTFIALAAGCAALAIGYFLDCSRLLRWWKPVYITAVAAGVLILMLSPRTNLTKWYYSYDYPWYAGYWVQILPIVYALWVYGWRGKGWKGFFLSVAGGIPLAVLCAAAPCPPHLIILLITGFVLLGFAVVSDWFHVSKPAAAAFLAGLAAAAGVLLMFLYGHQFDAALHPDMYYTGPGGVAIAVRELLKESKWLGACESGFQGIVFMSPPQFLRAWSWDFLPVTAMCRLGRLPFLLLALALSTLLARMAVRCLRCGPGRMPALAVVTVLVCRGAFSLAMNLGFVLYATGFAFPLVTGNLQSVIDMGMIGLALSVFRGSSVFQACDEKVKVLKKQNRIGKIA